MKSVDAKSTRTTTVGRLMAVWGLVGFALLVLRGLWRLVPMASSVPFEAFSLVHWVATAASILAFGYGEGVVAIQRGYVPRLRARAERLLVAPSPSPLYGLLAPLYCMGLIGADWKTLARGWGMLAAIVLMILGMRFVPTPWREIVILGVVVALVWAILVTLREAWLLARGR